MLQSEFEKMINKEVDVDTYNIYNAMYMSCPESWTKQDFINSLNISAIPESQRAIQAREEHKAFIAEKKAEIEELKKQVEWYIEQEHLNLGYAARAKQDNDKELIDYYTKRAKMFAASAKPDKTRIKELRFLINA